MQYAANYSNHIKLDNFDEIIIIYDRQDEQLLPFLQKHNKLASSFGFVVPLGIIGASSYAQIKLSDSLSDDIKEKAQKNFIKGKEIQKIAREHFDKVDAIEV
jgi:hypothetical protein